QSIAMAALFTAYHLGCKAILALTESGSTALWMSRQKIHVPIFGLTSQVRTQRRMAIYRNVHPILMPNCTDRDEALKQAEQLLVQGGVLKPGDTYAITCGEPMGYPGGTNMLKVGRVGGWEGGRRGGSAAGGRRHPGGRRAPRRRGDAHAVPAVAHADRTGRLRD